MRTFHRFIYFFTFLTLGLILVACQKTPKPTATIQISLLTSTPLLLPTPTDTNVPPTPTISPTPTITPNPPTSTPSLTPTPSPTLTPSPSPTSTAFPLPAFLQSQTPLGFNWGIHNVISSQLLITETDPMVSYQTPGYKLFVANALTGETVLEISANEQSIESIGAGNIFYVILYNENNSNTIVRAYTLPTGNLLWETIPFQSTPSEFVALNDGLLLIQHHYNFDYNNTLTFLNATDGKIDWQISPKNDCFIRATYVQQLNNHLHIACQTDILRLDATTGQELASKFALGGQMYLIQVTTEGVYVGRMVETSQEVNEIMVTTRRFFLEKLTLDYYRPIWSVEVPDYIDFVIYDGDLIYSLANQVVRLDSSTGQVVWQTTILSEVRSSIILQDQWLLVGSSVGYLHFLDVENGEVIWEQDVWATLEPRFIYIRPVALLQDTIFLAADLSNLVSLTTTQIRTWIEPTPIIAPSPTPLPIFTPLSSGMWPAAPEAIDVWPSLLLAFLNGDSDNVNRLELLLTQWVGAPPTIMWNDLDGDSQDEMLVLFHGIYMDSPGWVLIFDQSGDGQFQLAWSQKVLTPLILALTDVNGDSFTDLVFIDMSYGISHSYGVITPVAWDGQAYQNLASNPIASTNIILDDVRIEDVIGDSRLEIVFEGGTYGSLAAGPNRSLTFTYALSDQGYMLFSQQPELPQEYYFFLLDANRLLVDGHFEEAIALYESSYQSRDAWYDETETNRQHAFAEFQLMLAYLLAGDEEGATFWANSGNYPDELYSEVKLLFWAIYRESGNWTMAAETARTRVRLAGFSRAQLVSWVGYGNTPLSLDDICPCPDCLQGSIGSLYMP